jgi:4-hydroxy-tetrahydrodipicolinate synthase
LEIRQDHPEFLLLAGTGTPSLEETIELTRAAFDLGFDAVVVLPPYYYRNVSEDGLFSWFSTVIRQGSPGDGSVLGYHFPAVSGVPLSIGLISRLKDAFCEQFAGIKDSSGQLEFAKTLGSQFRDELNIFNGNDRLFSHALNYGASGCITAAANLISPNLRNIWNSFHFGILGEEQQNWVDGIREILDRYTPFPPLIKALLSRLFGFQKWPVCPPLLSLSAEVEDEVSLLLSNSALNHPIFEDHSTW